MLAGDDQGGDHDDGEHGGSRPFADLFAVGAGHVNPTRAEGEKKSYTVTISPAANSGSPPAAFTAGCIKRVSNLISVTFSTGT